MNLPLWKSGRRWTSKKLYDADGTGSLSYPADSTLFTFRLYLGTENADPANLPLTNLYSYFVKDPDGNYCRWDAAQKKFVSMQMNTYSELSAYLFELTSAEKEAIVFVTSMNGSVSKIPAGYTVEFRDLIVGTQWKVEERDYEIPRGYTLRLEDGYMRTDTGENTRTEPITGTIQVNEDPKVLVSNQKGWGLTIRKIWTDRDFMESHDDIYFAVYLLGDDPETPVSGTVKRMSTKQSELYYFFSQTQMGEHQFSEYSIWEVELKGEEIKVAADGSVSGYTSISRIEDDGELLVGGKPVGGEPQNDYRYTVNYVRGEQTTQNENVRTDTVTNSRPGIALYKTDWSGNSLSGAVFTLKDDTGADVAAETYTSREDGLITIAYLSKGTYHLKEIEAPKGYVAIPDEITITIGENNSSVSINGPENLFYPILNPGDGMSASIIVKNRATALQAVKLDATTREPISGVHFALYRQVKDISGNPRKDYQPMPGYYDLVTDEHGILSDISMDLPPDTYYLTETAAADGYAETDSDLCFTIGVDGTVSLDPNLSKWAELEILRGRAASAAKDGGDGTDSADRAADDRICHQNDQLKGAEEVELQKGRCFASIYHSSDRRSIRFVSCDKR